MRDTANDCRYFEAKSWPNLPLFWHLFLAGLNNALRKLFPAQMKQRREAHGGVKQIHPLPRTQTIPSVWLPLFSQQMTRTRNRRRMFWSLQPNSTLDYHDFGRLWVQTLRWRFTVAGYGLLALLFVCACSVLVINFVWFVKKNKLFTFIKLCEIIKIQFYWLNSLTASFYKLWLTDLCELLFGFKMWTDAFNRFPKANCCSVFN